MEKIMNVQTPSVSSAGVKSRSVQSTDAGDGFLKMLQQKQETADAGSESSKTVRDSNSGQSDRAEKAEQPEKEPKDEDVMVSRPEEEPAEDVQNLAMELAVQQAAVQASMNTEPVQTEVLETAAMEGVLTEVSVDVKESEAFVSEPVQTEEAAGAVLTDHPQEVQQPVIQANASEEMQEQTPEDGDQQASLLNAEVNRMQENAEPMQKDAETVHETVQAAAKESVKEDTEPEALYSAGNQSQPVQAQNHLFRTENVETTAGTTLKTTVEELPQELGKAFTSVQTQQNQTLTVELEPASLGKLTIRLEYEAGRAAVSILSSNPKTLEILSEKASEIASILKERTGEETVVYTQEAQEQRPDQYEGHQGSAGGQREQKREKEEERQQTESFAQQLRLGLV